MIVSFYMFSVFMPDFEGKNYRLYSDDVYQFDRTAVSHKVTTAC